MRMQDECACLCVCVCVCVCVCEKEEEWEGERVRLVVAKMLGEGQGLAYMEKLECGNKWKNIYK